MVTIRNHLNYRRYEILFPEIFHPANGVVVRSFAWVAVVVLVAKIVLSHLQVVGCGVEYITVIGIEHVNYISIVIFCVFSFRKINPCSHDYGVQSPVWSFASVSVAVLQ